MIIEDIVNRINYAEDVKISETENYSLSKGIIKSPNLEKAVHLELLKKYDQKKEIIAYIKAYNYPWKKKILPKKLKLFKTKDGLGKYEYEILKAINSEKKNVVPEVIGYIEEWDAVIMEYLFSEEKNKYGVELFGFDFSKIGKKISDLIYYLKNNIYQKNNLNSIETIEERTYEDALLNIKRKLIHDSKNKSLIEKQKELRLSGLVHQAELQAIGTKLLLDGKISLTKGYDAKWYAKRFINDIKWYLAKMNIDLIINEISKKTNKSKSVDLEAISDEAEKLLHHYEFGGGKVNIYDTAINLTNQFTTILFNDKNKPKRNFFVQWDSGPENMTLSSRKIFDFDEATTDFIYVDALPWLKNPLQNIDEAEITNNLCYYLDYLEKIKCQNFKASDNFNDEIINFYLLNILRDIHIVGVICRDEIAQSVRREEYLKKDKDIYKFENVLKWYVTDLERVMNWITQTNTGYLKFENDEKKYLFNDIWAFLKILRLAGLNI